MTGHPTRLERTALLVCGIGIASLASPVSSQPSRSDAQIRQQYQEDRAACLNERSPLDREACLKEAGAAQAAARQGQLAEESERYSANALLRCATLPPEYRDACRMRMQGQGTTRGSVESGGIYRELVTREIGPPPATAARPALPPQIAPAPSVAPAPSIAPAPSALPPPQTLPPPRPSSRAPGAPTFTPVPVGPGQGTMPVAPQSAAPGTSLQITPPDTPVQRVPEPAALPPPVLAPAPSTQ